MAEKVIRVCDVCMTIDGEGDNPEAVAVRTLEVTSDGQPALLDVCAGHDKEFTEMTDKLADFTRAATPVIGARSGPKREFRDPVVIEENKAIREWVRGQGEAMADRGRISDELRARYRAAVANGE